MAQHKRQYGSGCLIEKRKGWAIRWRELEIAPDGTTKRVLRHERLGPMSRRDASAILAQKVAAAAGTKTPTRSRVPFRTLTTEWEATKLPMYRPSTQKNHRHITAKHLLPRFGDMAVCDISRRDVQAYVAHLQQSGYAPKTIDHIHDVLSAVLRTAVEWGHLTDNPARGVTLPQLTTVKQKWALTVDQAAALLNRMPPLAHTMTAVALLTGLRRGELFALRWKRLDLDAGALLVEEAVYEGKFGPPKTRAGLRAIPLVDELVQLLRTWRQRAKRTEPDDLVFSTVTGKSISPNNVLRRWVFPACATLGLPNASWLTFRRTYSTWAHTRGVPGRVLADLMGHEKVDMSVNVYAQTIDGAKRSAAETVSGGLFTIVHAGQGAQEPTL
jgi:integrase